MIELGLQRISRLLTNTPLSWQAIHVAGTNGKGSICMYISAMLEVYNNSKVRRSTRDRALRHGRFTSPHVIDRWDCISIDQQTVRSSVFKEVEEQVLRRNAEQSIAASEFELLTATAFEIFNQEEVDVGVVEVGMGGRLDATNVIGQVEGLSDKLDRALCRPLPLVTAFASIGLDHQEFLGNALEDITREKLGILKQGIPVVYSDANYPDVIRQIKAAAEAKRCPVIGQNHRNDYAPHIPENYKQSDAANVISRLRIPQHVRSNLTVAFNATWAALSSLGRIPDNSDRTASELTQLGEDMVDVVNTTQFPGRQQHISIESVTGRKPSVLLDGAHNRQSAEMLAETVNALRSADGVKQSITWLLAASSSKDVEEILSPLMKEGDKVFAVEFGKVDGMPWVKPLPGSGILEAARAVLGDASTLFTQDLGSDLRTALQLASDKAAGGPLVIAGSLYLVGDVLRLLRNA